jgi:chromosomal replication initiator protein
MLSTAYPPTYPLWITFIRNYNYVLIMNTLTNSALTANNNLETFWAFVTTSFSKELSPQQFKTWIKPLFALGFNDTDNVLSLAAPNRFKLDWAKNQFNQRFIELSQNFYGRPVTVEWVLDPKVKLVNTADKQSEFLVESFENTPQSHSNDFSDIVAEVPSIGIDGRSRLNPSLTFDSFVTGKANQLARAAAIQVANNPGSSYNPMYLYGGVGLGKTHLIHAIGNHLLQEKPKAKIRYIHAEQYVSDVVKAYQQKSFDKFKQYYHSLDLLLIDDIQFFAGKPRSQEEFFYAFEALTANKSQVIMTSDTYPKEISGIDDRLISRFDSGLTVAIEPPELEMRVAILMKKALSEGLPLTEDVAFFVAKHLRSNVRELEGALRKILAYVRFHGKEITIEVAREALKDLLSVQNRQISVENIQKTVADFYNIKIADMYSKKRPANIARPRQIAMYIAKELTQKSLPEIGELFGGRDHTTVLHAVRKITEERSRDNQLNHELHVLEQSLKN